MNLSPTQRRVGRWILALVLVVPPAVVGTGAFAIFGGVVGSMVPVVVVGLLVIAGITVASSPTPTTRRVVVGAGVGLVSLLAGFGTWMAMIGVGIGIGALGIMEPGTAEDQWMTLCAVVGLAAVPVAWWLIQRAVHPLVG